MRVPNARNAVPASLADEENPTMRRSEPEIQERTINLIWRDDAVHVISTEGSLDPAMHQYRPTEQPVSLPCSLKHQPALFENELLVLGGAVADVAPIVRGELVEINPANELSPILQPINPQSLENGRFEQ